MRDQLPVARAQTSDRGSASEQSPQGGRTHAALRGMGSYDQQVQHLAPSSTPVQLMPSAVQMAGDKDAKEPAAWKSELAGAFSSLATAKGPVSPPPWQGQSPLTGVEGSETLAPKPLKPEQVVDAWKAFLGPGPYSNSHPRTGVDDPFRLVSADGTRSIRYGNHERNGSDTKHHFHEETWTWDNGQTLTVTNTQQRVPLLAPKKTGSGGDKTGGDAGK